MRPGPPCEGRSVTVSFVLPCFPVFSCTTFFLSMESFQRATLPFAREAAEGSGRPTRREDARPKCECKGTPTFPTCQIFLQLFFEKLFPGRGILATILALTGANGRDFSGWRKGNFFSSCLPHPYPSPHRGGEPICACLAC